MILRDTLLYLSEQEHLRRWVEESPLSQKFTRRFVAGKTLAEGLAVCARLNAEGILATLDHLGENITSIEEGAASRNAYLEALEQIEALGLEATISIKLTHFGLDFSEQICRDYAAAVVAAAHQRGNSVEVDMESLDYVDRTLAFVVDEHARYGCVRSEEHTSELQSH